MMSLVFPVEVSVLIAATAVAGLAGLIKGMVGFALPTIMITGLTTVMEPSLALAGLILSALVTNAVQAMRHGWRAAVHTVRRHRLFMVICLLFLALGAQMVAVLHYQTLFLMIGISVMFFAVLQLSGRRFEGLRARPGPTAAGMGAVAGFVGGFSGIWGPPTVIYLTLLDTEKAEQIRAQGVIYGAGATMLLLAHLQSGVLNLKTAPLSLWLVIPALAGMALGTRIQNRIDQNRFKLITLIVLLLGGANLVRRGLLG